MSGTVLNENAADPVSGDTDHAEEPPRVSPAFMAAYFFAQFAAWMAIFTPIVITIALKVNDVAPGVAKNAGLGQILAIGAIFALIGAPLWGAISDRTRIKFGKRRFWILTGTTIVFLGLVTIATAESLLQIGAGWIMCQIGSNATQASLYAVMADAVPHSQRGRMSGILGLCVPLAMLAGTFVTQFTTGSDWAMFLVPWLPSAVALPVFCALLKDGPARNVPPFSLVKFMQGFWVNPIQHPDFGWAFLSRFMVLMGAAFLMTYQVFFFIDRLGLPPEEVPQYVFLTKLTIAGLTVALTPLSGWLADRVGRLKPFVFLPAIILTLGLLTASVADTLALFLVAVVLVGIGQSVYAAVDLALCVGVLPDKQNSARYMGVMGIASSLPQSLAPAMAPLLLAIGAGSQNYTAMFLGAAIFGLLGALTVVPIRKVR